MGEKEFEYATMHTSGMSVYVLEVRVGGVGGICLFCLLHSNSRTGLGLGSS